MNNKDQEAINSIIDNFDFDKVQHAMEILNWRWASSEDKVVPLKLIVRKAIDLLNSAINLAQIGKSDSTCSTGGLRAEARWDDRNQEVEYLRLSFELTSWEENINV
jgi:hypothetical protein